MIVGGILAVLALWHLYYVVIAMQQTGHDFLLNEYGMLALGLVMLSLCVGIFLICTNYRCEMIWLAAMLLLGISSIRVMPGLSAPDEPAHYISAYYLSNQLMMTEPDDELGRVYIRQQDLALEDVQGQMDEYLAGEIKDIEIFGQEPLEKNYYEARNWNKLHPAEPGTATSVRIRIETTPIVYLPQAIGISIARTINAGTMTMVTLAKLFNLITFTAMVLWALSRMPFGKKLMMASTLLPMTINLAASMSYDAMLIGCAYMFIAKVLQLSYGENPFSLEEDARYKVGWKDVAVLAILLAIMSPCKMVYCVMAALVLIIPKDRYESGKPSAGTMQVLTIIICVVAAVGSVLAVNLATISRYTEATSNALVWAEGAEGFTATYVIHHPVETLRMVYDTLVYNGGYYHQTLIGAYLGNASTSLDVPYVIIMIISVCLILLAFDVRGNDDVNASVMPEEVKELGIKNRIIIIVMCVVLFGLCMGSMLIGWTPLGSTTILGVQGRYLLPVLPLILMLFKNKTVVLTKDISNILLFTIVACDAYAFFRMYSMVCLHI